MLPSRRALLPLYRASLTLYRASTQDRDRPHAPDAAAAGSPGEHRAAEKPPRPTLSPFRGARGNALSRVATMPDTPSACAQPTGRMDVGSADIALANWLLARETDGRFLLRLDDTAGERSREDFVRAFAEDLAWLGLGWDLFARQSERLALYAGAAEKLKAARRLVPYFETDSAGRAAARQRAAAPWVYDRAALAMTEDEQAAGLPPARRRIGASSLRKRPSPGTILSAAASPMTARR